MAVVSSLSLSFVNVLGRLCFGRRKIICSLKVGIGSMHVSRVCAGGERRGVPGLVWSICQSWDSRIGTIWKHTTLHPEGTQTSRQIQSLAQGVVIILSEFRWCTRTLMSWAPSSTSFRNTMILKAGTTSLGLRSASLPISSPKHTAPTTESPPHTPAS
jgi:hypothetical protein